MPRRVALATPSPGFANCAPCHTHKSSRVMAFWACLSTKFLADAVDGLRVDVLEFEMNAFDIIIEGIRLVIYIFQDFAQRLSEFDRR